MSGAISRTARRAMSFCASELVPERRSGRLESLTPRRDASDGDAPASDDQPARIGSHGWQPSIFRVETDPRLPGGRDRGPLRYLVIHVLKRSVRWSRFSAQKASEISTAFAMFSGAVGSRATIFGSISGIDPLFVTPYAM